MIDIIKATFYIALYKPFYLVRYSGSLTIAFQLSHLGNPQLVLLIGLRIIGFAFDSLTQVLLLTA